MLGLFGTLSLAQRSLQTQRTGVEVAGQNLANVNNPAYARQRVAIETSVAIPTSFGPQGTGADAVAIVSLRDRLLDLQVQDERSARGSLEAQQQALQYAQAALGQQLDRLASSAEGATAAGGTHGIAGSLNDLFAAFQNLSTNPTSIAERQVLLFKATSLATQFNQTDARLGALQTMLDDSLRSDTASANQLLDQIAQLNDRIFSMEVTGQGLANDLRDSRQQKLEELSHLVKFDAATDSSGMVSISVGGVTLVDRNQVTDRLESYDAGGGQILVRAQTAGTPLTLAGGRMQGTIQVRDVELTALRTKLDTLATTLVSEINSVHAAGFGLTGATGANFFTGTSAADIAVNAALLNDPALLQASGTAGAVGDNQVALALAQLAGRTLGGLGNQTLSQHYGSIVAGLGESLSSANIQLENQQVVENMLTRQRDSVMGVSLDEEMSDLVKFQTAFQASAKLINTIDEMLATVLDLKR
jgi:flagellar hook-associated protein 1